MFKIINVLFTLCLLFQVSCQRVEIIGVDESKDGIDVPDDFDWDIYKQVDVKVEIADQYDGKFYYLVEIYDGVKLLDRGFVKGGEKYNTVVTIEKITNQLIVEQINPNGQHTVDVAIINGYSAELNFNDEKEKPWLSPSSKAVAPGGVDAVIPDDAIPLINGTVVDGGVYVVRNNYINRIDIIKNATLYITDRGIFHINTEAKFENTTIHVCYGGRLVGMTSSPFENVNIYNYGEVNVYGDFVFNGGSFINHSEAYLYNLTLNDATLKTNNLLMVGSRIPNGPLSSTNFANVGTFTMNNSTVTIEDNALLKARSVIATGGSMNFGSKAWLWADNEAKNHHGNDANNEFVNFVNVVEFNGTTISGHKDYALVLADELSVEENFVTGPIILDATKINGKEINDGDIWSENVIIGPSSKISIKHSYSILFKNYNIQEYNGVDPDPIDPPADIVYFDPVYTIVMEDSYPAPGDYDMNDMVCEWQLGIQQTLNNKVTKIGLKYEIKALGGLNKISGAVALRCLGITHANIKSVTLPNKNSFVDYFNLDVNNLEAGNTDVVIPLFEDAHKTFFNMDTPNFVNVFAGKNQETHSFEVIVEFNEPIRLESIAEIKEKIDFFVITMGDKTKRTEIHLFGNVPTSKASNPSGAFMNNRLIWGLELGANFAYPLEMKAISDAYPGFINWINGTDDSWYMNPNPEFVFKN